MIAQTPMIVTEKSNFQIFRLYSQMYIQIPITYLNLFSAQRHRLITFLNYPRKILYKDTYMFSKKASIPWITENYR